MLLRTVSSLLDSVGGGDDGDDGDDGDETRQTTDTSRQLLGAEAPAWWRRGVQLQMQVQLWRRLHCLGVRLRLRRCVGREGADEGVIDVL